jgi:hypothetical protein
MRYLPGVDIGSIFWALRTKRLVTTRLPTFDSMELVLLINDLKKGNFFHSKST